MILALYKMLKLLNEWYVTGNKSGLNNCDIAVTNYKTKRILQQTIKNDEENTSCFYCFCLVCNKCIRTKKIKPR